MVDEIGVAVDEMPVLGVVEGGGVGVEIGPEVVEGGRDELVAEVAFSLLEKSALFDLLHSSWVELSDSLEDALHRL